MPSQGTAAETYWQRSCVENGKGGAASHLQVRKARALRRDQQASLLITAISILSDGTSSSLERRVPLGESSAVISHHLPSAYVSWTTIQVRGRAGPRLRQLLSPDLEDRRRRGRLPQVIFVLFSCCLPLVVLPDEAPL